MVSRLSRAIRRGEQHEEHDMAWRSPKVVEIAVGCEINAYGCAVV